MCLAISVYDAYSARSALSALGMMVQTYVDLCLSLRLVVFGYFLRGRFVHVIELSKTLVRTLNTRYGVDV